MTAILQAYSPRVINGQTYNVCPGGRIPLGPISTTNEAIHTSFEVFNDGRAPVNPTNPDIDDRDARLRPLYGQMTVRDGVIQPSWLPTVGVEADEVGCPIPWRDLEVFNPTGATLDRFTTDSLPNKRFFKMLIFGRFTNPGKIIAKWCIFAGPTTMVPSTTGETAILDYNTPIARGSTFTDCTIAACFPQPKLNAFKGRWATFERCHIFWVIDGFGPYSLSASTSTDVRIIACVVERLCYFPGKYYANQTPLYWNGTSYTAADGSTIVRTAADSVGGIDTGHNDGNHSDPIEVHGAIGTHVYNPTTKLWDAGPAGGGVYGVNLVLLCTDAYGKGDPSGLGIPVPGQAGSQAGSTLGYGDAHASGYQQRPGKPRPVPQSERNNPTAHGDYACVGTSLYIGHVQGLQFTDDTSVVFHASYVNGGKAGFQEQMKPEKGFTFIEFTLYDMAFGPDIYYWNPALKRDQYPARFNDPRSAVRISPHPVTGAPAFDAANATCRILDPDNVTGQNGQAMVRSSSSTFGVRYNNYDG